MQSTSNTLARPAGPPPPYRRGARGPHTCGVGGARPGEAWRCACFWRGEARARVSGHTESLTESRLRSRRVTNMLPVPQSGAAHIFGGPTRSHAPRPHSPRARHPALCRARAGPAARGTRRVRDHGGGARSPAAPTTAKSAPKTCRHPREAGVEKAIIVLDKGAEKVLKRRLGRRRRSERCRRPAFASALTEPRARATRSTRSSLHKTFPPPPPPG